MTSRPSNSSNPGGWHVHKFGGTSLGDADCFRQVADILLDEPVARQAVVVSAMAKTTDALLGLVVAAEQSSPDISTRIDAIATRYRATVLALLKHKHGSDEILKSFALDLDDLHDVLRAIALVRQAGDRSRDLIAGYGEIWSSRLLAAYLTERVRTFAGGRDVHWVDARDLIVIERGEMGPAVQWAESRANAGRHFGPDTFGISVITGFIASERNGLHTTLGRNGSDFSASIVGALLEAEKITIWTDVDGVMSADPNRVPEAAIINALSYSEAMELAYFGAKVIHPQTMSPAVQRGIPIWIRNTFNPAAPGSVIGPDSGPSQPIKGITVVDDVALLNIEGAGMIGVPGTADRLFGALREADISVILISQASSEHSICIGVPSRIAVKAEQVVQRAFAAELKQGLVQSVTVKNPCSVIAVVGDGMAGMPGIAGRFLGTLGNAGINVKAIAQGSSERNISAVIARQDSTRALRAVHSGFYLSAETISIGIIGPGNVGQVLLNQMAAEVSRLKAQFNLDLRVRAIASSKKMLLSDRAINLATWQEDFEKLSVPLDWAEFTNHVHAEHLPHAVVVDCSASEDVAARYVEWLGGGVHVVTPNKKAPSGPLSGYDQLHEVRRRHNTRFLYETTVGAALPIVGTLRDLRETGDEIRSIDGIFSGTLAYLFNVFDGSKPFSTIVREAREAGYTEPDPRDDLSGMDVARKVIILSREMGMRLEMSDVEVESLTPAGLEGGSSEDFLRALPEHDAAMAERWSRANAANEVLRYVGRLDRRAGTATVRLESLPRQHPFANINLTDNIVRYASARYSENPLVVQGPGAGPAVTAAGVFADILRLATYLGAPL
ncbi:MAG: bifunctional aspartate kinase/homoserine dehydrogenase I [Gammaproteobacteria bacterium]|nr:bifunctional aspartate kinase/homoserine dehydrogenase I [Gammaproteobacteria bacterium]